MSSQPRAAFAPSRRLVLLILVGAAIIVLIGVLYIRSFAPQMSATEAGSIAVAHLQQQVGGSGWVVLSTRYQGSSPARGMRC